MTPEIAFASPVISVLESNTLVQVAELMHREAVGCIVVLDGEGRPVGIVTDRDLALRAVAWSSDPKTTTVTEVMSAPVHTVEAGAPLDKVIERMRSLGVRRVPVVDDAGHVVALAVLDDLFESLVAQLEDLCATMAGARRDARRNARAARVRHEVHESLGHLRSRLEYASWHAQEAFLHELDDIRARVAHALKRD
ncbi:MAG: CBS domain-containing protein [Planctomycetota bacterium]|nr:MAG: CBS domain-containing protein [Planctomycetota bacterium]